MKPTRKLSRRSFLAAVAGGAVTANALGLIAPNAAQALQCSDDDRGSTSDPSGAGRKCRSGCSDSDSGAYGDPGGRGRRCAGNPVLSGPGLRFRAPGK